MLGRGRIPNEKVMKGRSFWVVIDDGRAFQGKLAEFACLDERRDVWYRITFDSGIESPEQVPNNFDSDQGRAHGFYVRHRIILSYPKGSGDRESERETDDKVVVAENRFDVAQILT